VEAPEVVDFDHGLALVLEVDDLSPGAGNRDYREQCSRNPQPSLAMHNEIIVTRQKGVRNGKGEPVGGGL
jgi:hypothetical protein